MPLVHHDYGPRGTFYEQKLQIPCTTCKGRKRIWLGGRDYVECPHCDNLGYHDLVEARVEPVRYFPMYKRGRAGLLTKQVPDLVPVYRSE